MKYIVYLLTIVLSAIKCVTGDTFVFQQYSAPATSASAREAIELLECETSDFISLDLWSPTALTSIRSITSSGASCNSGSIKRRSRMWMNSRSNRIGLEQEHYWQCYQRMRETVCVLVFARRADISNIDCSSWTTGHLDKMSVRGTEM